MLRVIWREPSDHFASEIVKEWADRRRQCRDHVEAISWCHFPERFQQQVDGRRPTAGHLVKAADQLRGYGDPSAARTRRSTSAWVKARVAACSTIA